MKWLFALLLACSVASARPSPPPQIIYVTNYVFHFTTNFVNTTNYVFVSGVITNSMNVTNTIVYTNPAPFLNFTNPLFFGTSEFTGALLVHGTNGSVTTFSNGTVTGHLP